MLQGETRGREEWGLTGVSLLEMKRHKAKHVKTLPLIFIWWNVEASWWCTDVVPAQITSHLWKWVNKDIPSLPLIFAFTFSGRNIRIIENHNGKAFSKLSTNYNYENLGKIDFFPHYHLPFFNDCCLRSISSRFKAQISIQDHAHLLVNILLMSTPGI